MSEDSDKARTNKKWTSTDSYRSNYDNIFKKENDDDSEDTNNSEETGDECILDDESL